MTGAIVLVMMETNGEAEVATSAGTEILTTGDAVGTSPFSKTGAEGGGIESEDVGFCNSIAESLWTVTKDSEIVLSEPPPLVTTGLPTTCTTGTDCVSCTDAAGTIRVEVTPFSTTKVFDPEAASEYVVPSTTTPEPPAAIVWDT